LSPDINDAGKLITDVERYYNDLLEIGIKKESDLEDKNKFYAASMLIFSLGNRAIEVGNQIIAAKNIEVPGTYEDIFNDMKDGRRIDEDLSKKLVELIRLRNIFAHRYFKWVK
jgi:uncharacterized protein YutE (UPF0331/DUF86 family)